MFEIKLDDYKNKTSIFNVKLKLKQDLHVVLHCLLSAMIIIKRITVYVSNIKILAVNTYAVPHSVFYANSTYFRQTGAYILLRMICEYDEVMFGVPRQLKPDSIIYWTKIR